MPRDYSVFITSVPIHCSGLRVLIRPGYSLTSLKTDTRVTVLRLRKIR